MATAPYNYSYIFKYIIIGKYEIEKCFYFKNTCWDKYLLTDILKCI